MLNIQATGQIFGKIVTLKQVSKKTASKLFANGSEIYLQSSNMYPFGVWQSVCPIKLDVDKLHADIRHNQFCINLHSENIKNLIAKNENWSKDLIIQETAKLNEYNSKVINAFTQFNDVCNDYKYYNCDSERGKYIHYYTAI